MSETKKPALKTGDAAMAVEPEAREVARTAPKPGEKPEPASKPSPEAKKRAALAEKIRKLRDDQGKSWKEIEKATGQNPGQLRRLYNVGKKASA